MSRRRKSADSLGRGGRLAHKNYENWLKNVDKVDTLTTANANLQVGDFISELAAAIRWRAKTGEPEGDWIEDPERAYTDGQVFGTEIQSATQAKLQLTLSLDASHSMWGTGVITTAGPAFQAIDKMIRTAQEAMPPDTLMYEAFVFHERAYRLPANYVKYYAKTWFEVQRTHRKSYFLPSYPTAEDQQEAGKLGDYTPLSFPLSGQDTKIAPLFEVIQKWETRNDPGVTRLDLVVTDGIFEDKADVERAGQIAYERNGTLSTILLNFAARSAYEEKRVQPPARCVQYHVTPQNLTNQLRDIVSYTIDSILPV